MKEGLLYYDVFAKNSLLAHYLQVDQSDILKSQSFQLNNILRAEAHPLARFLKDRSCALGIDGLQLSNLDDAEVGRQITDIQRILVGISHSALVEYTHILKP